MHLQGTLYIDTSYPRWSRQGGGTRDKRDIRAGFSAGARQRVAHLARTGIGQATHGIKRFKSWSCGQQHARPCQQLGLKARRQRIKQLLGFQHAPCSKLAARLFSGCRTKDTNAVSTQLRHITLRRRVIPHLTIHGWCDI